MASHRARTPLRPGIYAPTLTFFDASTEDLDLATITKHSVRLAQAGLVGLVTLGSNGEAVHLSTKERAAVTRATRTALDAADFTSVPVICGAAEQSVRGTLQLCREGAVAGAEYALVVPPSYYKAAMDEDTLEKYYIEVADQSPLPLIIYNYPGAVAGIDMTSDLIIRVSQHPNIVGTKFTCGNTGKLTRVASAMDAVTSDKQGSGYMAFGGMADFTAQTAMSGGSGIIAGGANVIPEILVHLWSLCANHKWKEAMRLQVLVSEADWVLTKGAVPGTKAVLQAYEGYGGYARRPLKRIRDEELKLMVKGVREAHTIGKTLLAAKAF